MALTGYRLSFAVSAYTGTAPPAPKTFGEMGVESAVITFTDGGDDSLKLTAAVSLDSNAFPFLPLAKHTLRDADNNVRFIGWLSQPGRKASGSSQSQEFTFEGPSYLLRSRQYQQPWQFAVDPTSSASTIAPHAISRTILFRDETGARRSLADQIKAVLDFAIAAGADFTYGPLTDLPEMMPLEDEQQDQDCLAVLKRLMRYAPLVTMCWSYPQSGTPQLHFVGESAATLVVVTDDGSIEAFSSNPRYDLLVKKITVNALSDQTSSDGGVRWATLSTDVSEADNGSIIEQVFTYTLRGDSYQADETGTPLIGKESLPTGIAAALHAPFKTLYNALAWSTVRADVDWSATLGMVVDVQRSAVAGSGGSVGLLNAGVTTRSAIKQITRTLATGATSFQAGPPNKLGLSDLLNGRRAGSAARNAANAGSYQAGFKPGPQGPQSQLQASCPDGGGEGGLGPRWYNCAVNGVRAYVLLNADAPVSSLPAGASTVNPP